MIFATRLINVRAATAKALPHPEVPRPASRVESVGLRPRTLDTPAVDPVPLTKPLVQEAVGKMEQGPVRQEIERTVNADWQALEQHQVVLDAAGSAANVPPEAAPHFAAAALRRGLDVDDYLSRLGQLFKSVSKSKDHVRTLRSLLVSVEQGGGDTPALVEAIGQSRLKPRNAHRTAAAMLSENEGWIPPAKTQEAIDLLQAGKNPAEVVEGRMHAAMVERLNLNALLRDANVRVTQEGLDQVSNELRNFFAQGAAQPNVVPPEMLQRMLVAVLENRFQGWRFENPATAQQLSMLTPQARAAWMKSAQVAHVRFAGDGQAQFNKRVNVVARFGKAIEERLVEAWGPLDALQARRDELAETLRNVDKNAPERAQWVEEIRHLPPQIEALAWARQLAELTPDTITPHGFAALAKGIRPVKKLAGDELGPALAQLSRIIRIDDLSYSHVISDDGWPLATFERLLKDCVHWPSSAALAYLADANKRIIVTKGQGGQERRAVVRIVKRTDPGREREGMLVLERAYPDAQSQEEKGRLIEHTLRRALEMGISAAFPTEYYWDAAKTARGQARGIVDMNAVIEDLNARYGTTAEKKVLTVVNPAGNTAEEYIDSAPKQIADRGQMQVRRYPGNADHQYQNEFMVLEPKGAP